MKTIIDSIVFFLSMIGLIVAIMAADVHQESSNRIKQLEQTPAVSCEEEPECWEDTIQVPQKQWQPVGEDTLIQIKPDMEIAPVYRRRA